MFCFFLLQALPKFGKRLQYRPLLRTRGMNGLDGRNGKMEESACGTSLEGEVCFGDLPHLLPTGQLSNVLLEQELLQGSPVLQAQTQLITRGCETRQQGGFPTSDIITFA